MGSCNAKLKSKNSTKKTDSKVKVPNKGFINVYDLSGSLAGNIETISADPRELSLKYKLKGNEFYQKQNFLAALENYNKAIKLYSSDSLYYTNRALVYKNLKEWVKVIEDCELALCQDSQNVKAYNLKGIAFIEKGKKIPSEINQITLGLDLLINARTLSVEKNAKLLPEINNNIFKGKKILFLKEKEIKEKRLQHTKSFLSLIIENNPEKKQEIFTLIDENLKQKNSLKVPDFLCCKITYDFIKNPLITPDGISYEKEALLEHCKSAGGFDPVTRNYFGGHALLSNNALKNAIEDFLEKEPWAFEGEDVSDYNKVAL